MFQPYAQPPSRRRSGVYMLMLCDRVVYVGQSTDVDMRIPSHNARKHHRHKRWRMIYDRAVWIELPPEELADYEGALIRALNPRYNKRAPGDASRDKEILFSLGTAPDPLRRFEKRVTKVAQLIARKGITANQRRRARRKRLRAFVEAS